MSSVRGIVELLGILFILGLGDHVKSNPVPESVTSAPLTNIRYVGVIQLRGDDICMGAFMTRKFLATSCRCLGDTDPATGALHKFKPADFLVRSWGKGPAETKNVENLYFYETCAIEPNKVLLDLGLIETAGEFSAGAVSPIGIPNASVFRFYEYIYISTVKETVCVSTTLNDTAAPGETVPVQLEEPKYCRFRKLCRNQDDIVRSECVLPTLMSNHICGKADSNCTVTAGAPLVCHGMLVGINAGSRQCGSVINPSLYLRMDFTMSWIQSVVCKSN